MILTVGGIKGGCGKSLISTNLCVMRAKLGKRVLLVDADEQGSASDWSDQRIASGVETPWTTIRLKAAAVRSEVMKLAKDYDDIIIDCGGRDTSSLRAALTVSDTFLVPFQPKSFDIWTSDKVSTLAQEAIALNDRLQAYAFINCGNTRGSDNEDAQKILSNIEGISLLPATITMRKAFSNATAEGLGIIEIKGDPKAIAEMRALHDMVFGAKKTKM